MRGQGSETQRVAIARAERARVSRELKETFLRLLDFLPLEQFILLLFVFQLLP